MVPDRYPKARWLGDGKSGGSYTGGPWKGVIHTTETPGLPSYNYGYTAPHLTYNPISRLWYQHTPLYLAARALRNVFGGVQTNRDRVIQIEIICYSAKWIADQSPTRTWVGHLRPEALDDIREFMRWASERAGISWEYPATDARMSPTQWDNYNGWCGHKHVPENTHWDPGALDWRSLMAFSEQEEEMIQNGDKGAAVVTVQEALLAAGYDLPQFGADGDYGSETEAAVLAFQEAQGLPATGRVGGVTAAFLIPGPPGPRGRRGPAGPQGEQGPPGPAGETPDLTGYTIVPPVV